MIGYSLGTVVAFNSLKTMKRLYDRKNVQAALVINDMQMWAGAYVLDWTKQENEILENNKACTVINGHLHNIYSEKDTVLGYVFPYLFSSQKPIGLYEIFTNIKLEDKEKNKACLNKDVTKISPSHFDYSGMCKDFLHLVKDSY